MKQLACTLLLILTTGVFAVETPPEIRGVLQRREAARAEADKVLHEAQAKANDEAVKELEKLLKAEKKKKVQPLTTTLEQRIEALNKESALLRDERLLQATAINERLSRKEFTAEEWDAVQGQVLVTVAAKESRTGVKVTMGPGELHLLVPHPDDLWQNNAQTPKAGWQGSVDGSMKLVVYLGEKVSDSLFVSDTNALALGPKDTACSDNLGTIRVKLLRVH